MIDRLPTLPDVLAVLGWRQEDLARESGIHPRHIQRLCRQRPRRAAHNATIGAIHAAISIGWGGRVSPPCPTLAEVRAMLSAPEQSQP